MMTSPRYCFFDIPFEIRRAVYYFLLPRRDYIRSTRPLFANHHAPLGVDCDDSSHSRTKLNVLCLSRQISEESLDILYGENIFVVDFNANGETALQEDITERNRRRIRYVLVFMTDGSVFRQPNASAWASFLPTLKVLQIIIELPIEGRGYWMERKEYQNAPTLEQELEDWTKAVLCFFECFHRYLGATTRLEIDGGSRRMTQSLISRLSPPACEIIYHPEGDFIFGRGRYSNEP